MLFFDHLLAIILVVIGPLRSGTGLRRLRTAASDEMPLARRRIYRTTLSIEWLLVLAAGTIWALARRPLADLGLEPRLGAGLAGVSVGFATIIAIMLRERRRAIADREGLAEVRARLEPVRFLLPHTRAEFGAFVWVALTAGVCEELLYRGYLIWYFTHALPWWAAALVTAVAFGFGHAYQGARGVAVGTVLGTFLAAVYFVTGSLFASIVIHALMDLHTGDLAWRAYEQEAHEQGPQSYDEEAPHATVEPDRAP